MNKNIILCIMFFTAYTHCGMPHRPNQLRRTHRIDPRLPWTLPLPGETLPERNIRMRQMPTGPLQPVAPITNTNV